MANFETPDLPEPTAVPKYFVGAASPLWAYFGAAAAGGVAFWWMTRWAQATNLEAMFGSAAKTTAPVLDALEDAVESTMETVAAAPELIAEAGCEAAAEAEPEMPVIPLELKLESDAAPETADETPPEPIAEAAPEPVIEAAPEPTLTAAPAPKPRLKKAAPAPAASDEA